MGGDGNLARRMTGGNVKGKIRGARMVSTRKKAKSSSVYRRNLEKKPPDFSLGRVPVEMAFAVLAWAWSRRRPKQTVQAAKKHRIKLTNTSQNPNNTSWLATMQTVRVGDAAELGPCGEDARKYVPGPGFELAPMSRSSILSFTRANSAIWMKNEMR